MGTVGNRALQTLLLVALAPTLVSNLGPRTNFDERLLGAHNREREQMAVQPLEWDPQLAAEAKRWASHLSRSGRFEHSPDLLGEDPQGENIWGGTPGHFQPETMIGLWIAEKKNYRDGVFPANSRSGRVEDVSHYTQVVWRETAKVGCGVSAEGAEEILVCRYSQPGNVIGERVT